MQNDFLFFMVYQQMKTQCFDKFPIPNAMLVRYFVRNSYKWMAKKPEIKWYDLLVCVCADSRLWGKRHCSRNYCTTGWVNLTSCINLRNTWTNTSSFIWTRLRCSFLSKQCFKPRVLCCSCQYLISIISSKDVGTLDVSLSLCFMRHIVWITTVFFYL